MARRVSTGITGRTILGDLFTQNDIIKPVLENATMRLAGNGGGSVEISETPLVIQNSILRLQSAQSGGYFGLGYTGSSTYQTNLPTNTAAVDQTFGITGVDVDGNVTLEYRDMRLFRSQDTSTDTDYSIPYITGTGGTFTEVFTNDSGLNYHPSTSTLKVPTLSATTITETSSIAYKENVEPISNALDKIIKLQGVTYDRKSTQRKEAGLIAEEVDKVLPMLVTYKDNKPDGINYTKLVAYLIEAVKELSQQLKKNNS